MSWKKSKKQLKFQLFTDEQKGKMQVVPISKLSYHDSQWCRWQSNSSTNDAPMKKTRHEPDDSTILSQNSNTLQLIVCDLIDLTSLNSKDEPDSPTLLFEYWGKLFFNLFLTDLIG